MRISDWSSDVCSSDLLHCRVSDAPTLRFDEFADVAEHAGSADTVPLRTSGSEHRPQVAESGGREQGVAQGVRGDRPVGVPGAAIRVGKESTEERSVGKEVVMKGCIRGTPEYKK